MTITTITALPTSSAAVGYSHVSTAPAGRLISIAGQLALGPDGEVVGASDPAAQARKVFENLNAALTAAGAGFADVIRFGIYVTDMSVLGAYREARSAYFAADAAMPTSTALQVSALVKPELVIEVEALAVVAE